jgi:uncharacterized protein YdcH (DUF465 family)
MTPTRGVRNMQVKEVWIIKINNEEEIDVNNSLLEQIKNIVKADFLSLLGSNIETALKELSAEFIKLGYTEEELEAQIKYIVNAYENGYRVSIYTYVYPVMHPVSKMRLIIHNGERTYTSEFYTKTRNELGKLIKEQISIVCRLAKLMKENEALKKRVEELEQRIQELESAREEEEESGIVEQGDP